jgi:hypothetical protein
MFLFPWPLHTHSHTCRRSWERSIKGKEEKENLLKIVSYNVPSHPPPWIRLLKVFCMCWITSPALYWGTWGRLARLSCLGLAVSLGPAFCASCSETIKRIVALVDLEMYLIPLCQTEVGFHWVVFVSRWLYTRICRTTAQKADRFCKFWSYQISSSSILMAVPFGQYLEFP